MTMKLLIENPESEQEAYKTFIKEVCEDKVLSPEKVVSKVMKNHPELFITLERKRNISDVIKFLREEVFHYSKKQEAEVNAEVLKQLSGKTRVLQESFSEHLRLFIRDERDIEIKLRSFFGDYAGQVYPYDPIPNVKGEGYKCRFTCRAPENTL